MALRSRTRLQLRRTVVVAALGALFVPAVADAKTKTPVITKITPKFASVGTKLTIEGKNFRRGKAKNSVLFRRDKGKALFVKSDVSTTKKLTVIVPKTLEKYMLLQGKDPIPTRFKLRVLSSKLSKAYTASKISPVIGPEKPDSAGNSDGADVPTAPDGDCDSDGLKNAVDPDDDNDLLSDTDELKDGIGLELGLDPCSGDTDGDGVEDGFEYQSAVDLNKDQYQSPIALPPYPYPGKTPYPNPLFKDGDNDYDGDGLTLMIEYKLWKYTYEDTVNRSATRTLSPLSYSDGKQYSLTGDAAKVSNYQPPQKFSAWTLSNGYASVALYGVALYPVVGPHLPGLFPLYDMDRDSYVTTTARVKDSSGYQRSAEATYWDLDADGLVSDDERDEDADGLTNYDETIGPLTSGWWTGCYTDEGPYPITFAGTKAFDADSDGDGILDGADDQDFDDVPNIMERSRNMAGNRPRQASCTESILAKDPLAGAQTWVQPFNPCLPDWKSRACQRHPTFDAGYPPYQPSWIPGIRN